MISVDPRSNDFSIPGTCNWPAAVAGNEGYDFRYVDESKNGDTRSDTAIPGIDHIEVRETTQLLMIGAV